MTGAKGVRVVETNDALVRDKVVLMETDRLVKPSRRPIEDSKVVAGAKGVRVVGPEDALVGD